MKKLLAFIILLSMVACKSTEKQKKQEEPEPRAYEILYKTNMPEEIDFIKQSDKVDAIELDYNAVGTQTRKVWGLKMVNMDQGRGSAAIISKQPVEYPFWGRITYQSTEGEAEMEFKIYEPGYWQIIMTTLTP